MESAGWMEIIASIAPNLGIGIIFLYLYVQERKASFLYLYVQERKASREANELLRASVQENNEKMLAAFMENTKVIQGFKHVLADNSRVLERLCTQVDDHTKRP
jgi:hypothetical protein